MRAGAAQMALVAIALVSTLLVPLPIADAHPARSFDACIGNYPPGGLCTNSADYLVGDHPHIRAEITPTHSNLQATLWRRVPHQAWAKLKTVAINERGRMAYQWTPGPGDARPHHPYRFRFVIHGHGTSDIAKLRIFKPDF